MGAIYKISNAEGKYLIGYQCDICGCNGNADVLIDSKFTGWFISGDDVYCPDCYRETHFECSNCGEVKHCNNYYDVGLCEDCYDEINGLGICDKCSEFVEKVNLISCKKYNMSVCEKCNNLLN